MNTPEAGKPILLFNDECGVCRRIGHWVQRSEQGEPGGQKIVVMPIGDDPEALRALNPELDIWDAYATIHLLMPDGSMELGGEAVAEVFRSLPHTEWFTWTFKISVFGYWPFQAVLNLAYTVLADVRPLLGCESCGTPSPLVRPIRWIFKRATAFFGRPSQPTVRPHFTALSAAGRGSRK